MTMGLHPGSEGFWEAQTRSLRRVVVASVRRQDDWVMIVTDDGLHFARSFKDLGRPIRPHDVLHIETIGGYRVTGIQDECEFWLFRESNADLAALAREHLQEPL